MLLKQFQRQIERQKIQMKETNPQSNSTKILYNQQLRKIIPQGACLCQEASKIQQIKQILKQKNFQNLVLIKGSIFFKCIIVKKIINDHEPIYHLIYQNQRKRLLSAQKQPNNIGCNYLISKNQKPKKDSNFVGKLRGNFLKKQFNIYDGSQKENNAKKRKQLGFIEFKQDSIFGTGSEKIQILVPKPIMILQTSNEIQKYQPHTFFPQDKQNLLVNQNKQKSQLVLKLTKQKSRYLSEHNIDQQQIEQTLSNLLNKNKKMLSLKLFEEQNQKEALFLKERSENTYDLLIGWPLNIVQGFGIALSLIQRNSK